MSASEMIIKHSNIEHRFCVLYRGRDGLLYRRVTPQQFDKLGTTATKYHTITIGDEFTPTFTYHIKNSFGLDRAEVQYILTTIIHPVGTNGPVWV